MLMMEVESDSGSEMWFNTRKSNKTEVVHSSSDSDNVPLATFTSSRSLRKRRKILLKYSDSSISPTPKKITKRQQYKCDFCMLKFGTKLKIKKHIRSHLIGNLRIRIKAVRQKKESFPCDGCERKFATESSLNRHKNAFPGQHSFKCQLCSNISLKKESFEKHMAMKHPEINATQLSCVCSMCGTEFGSYAERSNHLISAHNVYADDSLISVFCTLCGKGFVSEEGLRYHEETQHKEMGNEPRKKRKRGSSSIYAGQNEKFSCKICAAVMNSKLSLQSHLKTHNVKKNVQLKTGTYQCLICPRSFSSSDGLKYHLALHTGERRYQCNQCNKRFIKKTHLSEHIATHSEVKLFTCERCPRTFSTHSAYKKHIKMFPGPHNYFCSKCGKVFMKESMLEKHLCVDLVAVTLAPEVLAHLSEDVIEEYMCLAEEADRAEGKQGISCYKCLKVFPTEELLHDHQSEHVGKQPYKCRFCPEVFHRSDEFSAHIVNHLGSTPYMCRQCNRKFISPFTLATHLKNYPGEHSFTCIQCKRWFPSAGRLEKHDCILENVEYFLCACNKQFCNWDDFFGHLGPKPYTCCACPQQFVTLTPLTRHIKKHTGTKPFQCKVCGKAFSTKCYFKNHLKIHDQLPLIKCTMCSFTTKFQKRMDFHMVKRHDVVSSLKTLCPVCGLLLDNSENLVKHMASQHDDSVSIDMNPDRKKHTELCNLCGKLLNSKYSLQSHMKTVHGPNKEHNPGYPCQVCGTSFSRSNQLERHREKHDFPGQYSCSYCEDILSTRKDLRKHLCTHNAFKPFKCDKCDKRFKVSVSLKYHANICDKRRRTTEEPLNDLILKTGANLTLMDRTQNQVIHHQEERQLVYTDMYNNF